MEEQAAMKAQSGDVYYNVQERLRANLLQTYSKDIRPSSYHKVILINLSYISQWLRPKS